MRTKFLCILSFLWVVGLVSCDKSEDPVGKSGENVLLVKLPDNIVPVTRTVQDPVAGGVSTVTEAENIRVFLLSGASVIETDTFSDPEIQAGKKRFEQVSASIDNVIVVINDRGEDLSGLKTRDAVMKYAFTVASQNEVDGIDGKTLIGEGKPEEKPDPEAGPGGTHENIDPPHKYKEAAVKVYSITSRLEVGAVKPGTGVKSVELIAVYINNYYENGSRPTPLKLHPDGDPVWATDPAAGVPSADPNAFNSAQTTLSYTEPYYRIAANASVTYPNATKCYAFHVFTGDYVPHLIVLVKGQYEEEYAPEGKEYFFGWVTFSKFVDNLTSTPVTEMEANKIYKIGLKDGIPIDAKDITDQPEKDKMDVQVNITIEHWTEQEVTPQV